MLLYLIRHAESFINLLGWEPEEGTHLDTGLTPLGERQAAALADWMPREIPQIHAIYASTMQRARETVIPLARAYGLEVQFDDRLREVGNCLIDQSPVPSNLLPRSIAYVQAFLNPYLPVAEGVEGVETYMHFRSRVGLFLMSILARHREQSVAVICHGGVINAAFDDILNIGPYRRCDVWSQNTALTCFEYHPTREEEPWVLHYMGRAEHLFDCP